MKISLLLNQQMTNIEYGCEHFGQKLIETKQKQNSRLQTNKHIHGNKEPLPKS